METACLRAIDPSSGGLNIFGVNRLKQCLPAVKSDVTKHNKINNSSVDNIFSNLNKKVLCYSNSYVLL